MQWVLDNWIWILLGGGMVAMHFFGHGGHGGHGGRGGRGGHGKSCSGASQMEPESKPSAPSTTSPSPKIGNDAGEASIAEKHRDL